MRRRLIGLDRELTENCDLVNTIFHNWCFFKKTEDSLWSGLQCRLEGHYFSSNSDLSPLPHLSVNFCVKWVERRQVDTYVC